jgi:branched-chain amino acid transport system permease protein
MTLVINGLISGLVIGLLALAFTTVYLPTRVFHLALAGVYTCVPFVALTVMSYGWPWYVAVPVAMLTGICLSVGCELLNHRALERKAASSGVHLVSSLGLYILIVQAVVVLWGNVPKVLRTGNDITFQIADFTLTRAQLINLLISNLLLLAFYIWLRFSDLGLRFRALADNPVEMSLRGYNVQHMRLLAFGISGFLAAASALIHSLDVSFSPQGGLHALLLAIVAMIIGGRQTFIGPIIGGLLLGVVRSEVVWLLSASWQEALTFLLLGLFLLLRPGGLFSKKGRLEEV